MNPAVIAEIRIQVTKDGNVTVHGPVADKLFMFGALEQAKEAVRQHDARPKVEVAPPGVVLNGHRG